MSGRGGRHSSPKRMRAKVKRMALRAQEADERERRWWQPRRWHRQFDNTGEARQPNERTSRV